MYIGVGLFNNFILRFASQTVMIRRYIKNTFCPEKEVFLWDKINFSVTFLFVKTSHIYTAYIKVPNK